MSSGKKKHKFQKRTYTEGELRKIIHESRDEVVARTLVLAICSARDIYGMDADQVVTFMENVQRWNGFLADGILSMDDVFQSLKRETGIDLKLTRW